MKELIEKILTKQYDIEMDEFLFLRENNDDKAVELLSKIRKNKQELDYLLASYNNLKESEKN